MEVNIIARHFTLTPTIGEYVKKKLSSAVKKIHPEVISAHVVLYLEKKYRHTVEITASVPGAKFHSEGQTIDLYAAIDIAVDKLLRQLKKYKEKIKEHRKNSHKKLNMVNIEVVQPENFNIVERKNFSVITLSASDAIAKMLESDYNFYIFRNKETGSLSVAYKRPDDTYGLMELK